MDIADIEKRINELKSLEIPNTEQECKDLCESIGEPLGAHDSRYQKDIDSIERSKKEARALIDRANEILVASVERTLKAAKDETRRNIDRAIHKLQLDCGYQRKQKEFEALQLVEKVKALIK